MEKIKDIRRRLAALSTRGVEADSSSPATSLADCRATQSRLRELKREVLARIAGLRTEVREQARASFKYRPSVRETWQRRQEGAKKLLAGVQERVIGLVDGKHGDALEAWSQVSEEIDARLAQMERFESRLARTVGDAAGSRRAGARPSGGRPPKAEAESDDDLYAAAGAAQPGTRSPGSRPPKAEDAGGDDLYAAVGAEVQKGEPRGGYCPHCGRGLEPDDRFCRRCGHRLNED